MTAPTSTVSRTVSSRLGAIGALLLCVVGLSVWQLNPSLLRPVRRPNGDIAPHSNAHLRDLNDGGVKQVIRTSGSEAVLPRVGPVLASVLKSVPRVHISAPLPSASPQKQQQQHWNKSSCKTVPDVEFARTPGPNDHVRWGEREAGYRHLVVVSTGGVGTSYVMAELHNALSKYKWRINRMANASITTCWKHKYPAPGDTHLNQLGCWGADRVIYVFNDPVAQLQSLFRRGFQFSVRDRSVSGGAQWDKTETVDSFVAEVLHEHRDVGGFFQHMMAWLNAPTPCPILFADTRTLLQNMPLIAKFLSVPESAVSHMEWKARISTGLEEAQLPRRFLDVYANAFDQMKQYDLTVVIPENYEDPQDLRSIRVDDGKDDSLWPCKHTIGGCASKLPAPAPSATA